MKASFLNYLAAGMAAGPRSNPVGLLKKSNVAEQTDIDAKQDQHRSKHPQEVLAQLLKNTTPNAAGNDTSQSEGTPQ